MRTFLIDLENVKNQGMIGIESLAAEDRVFIFYSESANSLSIPTIQAMNGSKAQIDYVHLQRSGRNAMDFQIVALLGFLIGSERTGQFCIVSQDNGYLAPVEFFMDHAADQLDVHVLLAASIQKAVRKWNSMPVEQPKVMTAEPVIVVEEDEVEEEPEPEAEKKPAPTRVKTEKKRETMKAKAEKKTESARTKTEKKPEPIKTEEKPVAVEVKAEEQPAPVETKNEEKPVPVEVKAEEKPEPIETKSEPAQTESEAVEKKPLKRRGRPKKENGTEKVKKAAEHKSVEVPEDLMGRIHEIVGGHMDESQIKYEKVIGQALLSTKAKNEFYHYFRKVLGVQNGGDLYRTVRGDYERLKAAAAVNRPAEAQPAEK